MKSHLQKTDSRGFFYDSKITVNPDGSISCGSTDVFVQGNKYSLIEFSFNPGLSRFKLYIEKVSGGVDYFLDKTGFGTAVSFGEGIGALPICWRDFEGDDIHILNQIDQENA